MVRPPRSTFAYSWLTCLYSLHYVPPLSSVGTAERDSHCPFRNIRVLLRARSGSRFSGRFRIQRSVVLGCCRFRDPTVFFPLDIGYYLQEFNVCVYPRRPKTVQAYFAASVRIIRAYYIAQAY